MMLHLADGGRFHVKHYEAQLAESTRVLGDPSKFVEQDRSRARKAAVAVRRRRRHLGHELARIAIGPVTLGVVHNCALPTTATIIDRYSANSSRHSALLSRRLWPGVRRR